jgi:Flp pilus assembly protein TadG
VIVTGLRLRRSPSRRAVRRPWLRSRRGQAMVETALAAPFVLLLLAGGAQIASISYGQVTIDTAAREGARVATEHPVTALTNSSTGVSFFSTSGTSTYTCNGATDPNIVCQAVYGASGLFQSMFDKTKFTVVITANVPQARAPQPAFDGVPDDVEQIGCQGGVQVGGTVSGAPSNVKYDVSASGTGQTLTTQSNPQGSYSLCIAVSSAQTETITASYGTLSCGLPAYQGSAQVSITPSGGPYTTNIRVNPQACPTPQPTSSATPTPAPSATPFPSPTPLPTTHYGFTCSGLAANIDGTYITVQVSYPMPLFVPFVDRFLNNGNGSHTTTATVTMRVEPCGITQGT